ncbi:hypothetical protein JTE90_004009 [Oedothorax gibbosus]|uniref:Uncharacterized protein n=1 Tax=Oedothorax gibbosus TaxID=931172 RepID=A0AAV6U522_9ARAC|nr:hypothetical protein JTE90_004009 [Oedothorax gibbosus]
MLGNEAVVPPRGTTSRGGRGSQQARTLRGSTKMVQPTPRHRRSGQEGELSRASTSTKGESSSRHVPRARCRSQGVAGGGLRRGTGRISDSDSGKIRQDQDSRRPGPRADREEVAPRTVPRRRVATASRGRSSTPRE